MTRNPLSYHELFLVFGRFGIMSLCGPAAQIALMHKELVEDRSWLNEQGLVPNTSNGSFQSNLLKNSLVRIALQ